MTHLRSTLPISIAIVLMFALVPATTRAEQTVGDTIKKIFASPTPTPHRKRKTSPTPSPSPKKRASPSRAHEEEQSTPVANRKSPSPSSKSRRKKGSPTPSPKETESPSPTPSASTAETPENSPAPKRGAPNASLTSEAIKGFENYPDKVKKLLNSALDLTTRNLDYKYGSADPANGGMDCSGFVYYVLKQNGIADAPRDSSEQYVWLRRSGKFEPVVSQKEDSFEFANLRPGDLLFWTGTYSIERDPPITHAMIYLGREKESGKRVMIGASDGRTYQNQQRFGVSVFDFKMPRADNGHPDDGKHPRFIGYGHIPGISG